MSDESPKKAKSIKKTDDQKNLEDVFRNMISRPFMRRHPYLYLGDFYKLDAHQYFFGNLLSVDDDLEKGGLKFGDATQSLALVTLKTVEHQEAFKAFLNKLPIEKGQHYGIYFNQISALLAKIKFDLNLIEFFQNKEKSILCTVDGTTFPVGYVHGDLIEINRLIYWETSWRDIVALPMHHASIMDYAFSYSDNPHPVKVVPEMSIVKTYFSGEIISPLHFVAIRGYDVLDFRFREKLKPPLPVKQYFRLFRPKDSTTLQYAHCAEDDLGKWLLFRTDSFVIFQKGVCVL